MHEAMQTGLFRPMSIHNAGNIIPKEALSRVRMGYHLHAIEINDLWMACIRERYEKMRTVHLWAIYRSSIPRRAIQDHFKIGGGYLEVLMYSGMCDTIQRIPYETRKKEVLETLKDARRNILIVEINGETDPLTMILRGKRKNPGQIPATAHGQIAKAMHVRTDNDYYWSVYNEEYPYDSSFSPFLSFCNGRISVLVERIRSSRGHANVLDFMGFGHVLRDLPLTHGLAVALGGVYNTITAEDSKRLNIDYIEGNVLLRETWKRMEDWLKDKGIFKEKFDIILSRPVGGLNALSQVPAAYTALLQRAWNLLNPEGIILTQVPTSVFGRSAVTNWAEAIMESCPIAVSLCNSPPGHHMTSLPILSLSRNPRSPRILPF